VGPGHTFKWERVAWWRSCERLRKVRSERVARCSQDTGLARARLAGSTPPSATPWQRCVVARPETSSSSDVAAIRSSGSRWGRVAHPAMNWPDVPPTHPPERWRVYASGAKVAHWSRELSLGSGAKPLASERPPSSGVSGPQTPLSSSHRVMPTPPPASHTSAHTESQHPARLPVHPGDSARCPARVALPGWGIAMPRWAGLECSRSRDPSAQRIIAVARDARRNPRAGGRRHG
jgi:hypothetical protein